MQLDVLLLVDFDKFLNFLQDVTNRKVPATARLHGQVGFYAMVRGSRGNGNSTFNSRQKLTCS